MRGVGHDHVALYPLHRRRQPFGERHESEIEEDVFVIGVIDDVGDLVVEEARIDGMTHGAYTRHRAIKL